VSDIGATQTATGERLVTGMAIPFDSLSVNLGGFVEQFASSSVNRTLARPIDVRALAAHDSARLLGRVTARTLQISRDRRGLLFALALPDTTDGRDVFELVRRRDLTGASFAFSVVGDQGEHWDFLQTPPVRTIIDATIREISLVAWPAYESTIVHARASTAGGNLGKSYKCNTGNIDFLRRWHQTQLAR